MTSVLLTAFEPYDAWRANASWLALVELTQNLPAHPSVTTRLYPVDYGAMRERLTQDLRANHDFAIHLGQAPGSAAIRLETFGINTACVGCEFQPLVAGGPAAYQSPLPLSAWASGLSDLCIPAEVSHHAGTYLCNATLYLSCHLAAEMSLATRSAFIHLPLETSQAAEQRQPMASLSAARTARALRWILEELAREG